MTDLIDGQSVLNDLKVEVAMALVTAVSNRLVVLVNSGKITGSLIQKLFEGIVFTDCDHMKGADIALFLSRVMECFHSGELPYSEWRLINQDVDDMTEKILVSHGLMCPDNKDIRITMFNIVDCFNFKK